MSWKAYNALLDDPRLLVLDSRSRRSYLDRHIRGSICVKVSSSSNGRTLECLAGPGPPAWSQDCWWGRHVLVVSPKYSRESDMRKSLLQLESGADEEDGRRKRPRRGRDRSGEEDVDEVIKFLFSEGLMKSLRILEAERDEDAFSAFTRCYPFLVTRSEKAAVISGYPAEIVPKLLYLGDLGHAKAEDNLDDLHITHVLTIHTEPVKLSKRFAQLFCELSDEIKADISQYFERMFQFIEDARRAEKRVLVHCGAGASRSATLCAAYLMRVKQWKADQALKFLKDQRKQVDPNPGFVKTLYHYEQVLGLVPTENVASNSARDSGQSKSGSTVNSPEIIFDILKEGTLLGTVEFTKCNVLTCGRGSTCDLVLDHTSISRQHAKLEYAGKFGASVWDLGSVHGTFVNNVRLTPGNTHKLSVGDVVTFGASTRRYVVRTRV